MSEPESQPLEPFNLDTMSGVRPGSRTQVYQQIRLRALDDGRLAWAQVHHPDPTTVTVHLQADPAATRWQESPLCRLTDVPRGTLHAALAARLREGGWLLLSCATCSHWQTRPAVTHPDGLAMGRCTWQGDHSLLPATPERLLVQSGLTLACPHWTSEPVMEENRRAGEAEDKGEEPLHPTPSSASPLAQNPAGSGDGGWWRRLWPRRNRPAQTPPQADASWVETLAERSGVGAGTEPCFACQGRLANWGALTLATPEGDKRTVSVWRCRLCGAWYLNDWVDRWERLDSLETEERYYRLAPAEALAVLDRIRRVPGGAHPRGREARQAESTWLDAFLAHRIPLSHQRRQGR